MQNCHLLYSCCIKFWFCKLVSQNNLLLYYLYVPFSLYLTKDQCWERWGRDIVFLTWSCVCVFVCVSHGDNNPAQKEKHILSDARLQRYGEQRIAYHITQLRNQNPLIFSNNKTPSYHKTQNNTTQIINLTISQKTIKSSSNSNNSHLRLNSHSDPHTNKTSISQNPIDSETLNIGPLVFKISDHDRTHLRYVWSWYLTFYWIPHGFERVGSTLGRIFSA